MRRLAAALAVVAVAAGLMAVGRARPPAAPQKKLIEYGWDVPYPDFVRQHARAMEERPFDGVVVRLRAGLKVFAHRAMPEAAFTEDVAHLKAAAFTRMRDNFVLMWTAPEEGWDWADDRDFTAGAQNVRLFARAARAGGLRGIAADYEAYDGNAFAYSRQHCARHDDFAGCAALVRRRGAALMRIMQQEFPDIRILALFQATMFDPALAARDEAARQRALAVADYGLLPAFLDGLLEAAVGASTIIDGNEPAYYYGSRAEFFAARETILRRGPALVAPANRPRYARHVQAGHAVFVDQLFALRPPADNGPAAALTPAERARWLEHNVYYALAAADEYAWVYSERMSWWAGQVPPGAEEAVRAARQKIRAGQALGFDIEPMVRAAKAARARASHAAP
jgi:hypothetical protein